MIGDAVFAVVEFVGEVVIDGVFSFWDKASETRREESGSAPHLPLPDTDYHERP